MDELKDKIIIIIKKAIANRAEVVDCYHDIMEIDCNDVNYIAEEVADALITAGIRDITREGYICMNGEVIVPTPNMYNKVADLLACPRIKEREIEEEKE